MNSKRLHKHSLPIIGLIGVGFAVSATLLTSANVEMSPKTIGRALVAHSVTIKPTRYGIARIASHKAEPKIVTAPNNDTELSDDVRAAMQQTHSELVIRAAIHNAVH